MTVKNILITGATSGIGKAVAHGLLSSENHLFLVARNRQKGEQLRTELLARQASARIDLLFADLSLLADIRQLARDFQKDHSVLDTLINCAGVVC